MRSKWIAAAAVGFAAASCTHIDPVTQSPDPQFGEAVKYDMAIQVINPDPVYPADAAQPGEDGVRAAAAVERLRTDQVNARHRTESSAASASGLSTTQGTSSGGGPQ